MTATETETDTLTRLRAEGLIRMPGAADYIAELMGHRPHDATVRGWARVGVRTHDGRTVKIETCQVGRRLRTSRAAVERFVRATQVPEM